MPILTIFDPQDYGAIANGTAKDTAAVQAAIDKAAALGGTVRLAGITAVDDEEMANIQRRFDHDVMGEPKFGGCRFDANAAHPIEDVAIRDFWYTAIGGVKKD